MGVTYDSEILPTPAWGSSSGALVFQPSLENVSEELSLDRILIQDRIYRYAWAFDERQLTSLKNCFTENAVWEGDIQGVNAVAPIHGRETIATWLSGFWERQMDQRRHMIFDMVVINQSSERAEVIVSLALTSASAAKLSIVLTSFYRFEVVREEEIWRIAHLFEGFDVDF